MTGAPGKALHSVDIGTAYPSFAGTERTAAFLLATAVFAAVADLTMVFAAREGQSEKSRTR
jgi:multidrug transporter EmrE-like cation transporter